MSEDILEAAISEYIPKMDGWSTPEKCYAMARLIKENSIQTSVELGIFGGRSLISMAFAHRHTGGATWGFDPWTASASLDGDNDPANYESFVHHILIHNLLDHCHWGRYKSDLAVNIFDDSSIGLLHQDSNHSEKVSCDEVERWNKKIISGGYWVMDDTNWPTTRKAQGLLLEKGYNEVRDMEEWKVFQKQ